VDVGVRVGEIYVPMECTEFVMQRVCFGGIRRADEMGVTRRTLPKEFQFIVILQPEALVCGIIMAVRWVGDEELDNVSAVVKAGWVGRCGSAEGNANEPPFAHVIIQSVDLMRNEEQLVSAGDDALSE
jgi:hypothetical protein